MSAVATSAMVVVGPWALVVASILLLTVVPSLVRLVLNKSVPMTGDRDISVKVRLFVWLRIEIEVKTPQREAAETLRPRSSDPPPAEVVQLREDVRESG
jgi:hypothetical protein